MATKERKKEATSPQKPFGLDVDRSRTSPGHSFSKAMLGTRYGVRWLLLFIIRCFTGNCLDDSRQNEPLAREIIALCHDLNSRDDSFLPPLVKVFALSDVITFWESCPTSTAISPLVSLLDILELDNPIAFNKIKQQILAEIAGGMTFKKAMANKKDVDIFCELARILFAQYLIFSHPNWFFRKSLESAFGKVHKGSFFIADLLASEIASLAHYFKHDADGTTLPERRSKMERHIRNTAFEKLMLSQLQVDFKVDDFEKKRKQALQVVNDTKLIEYFRPRLVILPPVNACLRLLSQLILTSHSKLTNTHILSFKKSHGT